MAERAELGLTQPAHELSADQTLIDAAVSPRESRKLPGLIKTLTPLLLITLAAACGGEKEETKTWTGILGVQEDCTLITPTVPSATANPIYYEHCPLQFSLEDKEGRVFLLEGEGEGFPDV